MGRFALSNDVARSERGDIDRSKIATVPMFPVKIPPVRLLLGFASGFPKAVLLAIAFVYRGYQILSCISD
jgi:hypothetical protein